MAHTVTPAQPMATEAAVTYFSRYADGHDHQTPLLVQTFSTPGGWRTYPRPFPVLTAALVQQLAKAGVSAVQLSAYARHADFRIVAAGPISPAYLD